MSASASGPQIAKVLRVTVDDERLSADLADGRTLSVPLVYNTPAFLDQ